MAKKNTNTRITLVIDIPEQQINILPQNISHLLELAALKEFANQLSSACGRKSSDEDSHPF